MLFEEDIKNRVQNINLFEVVYKKGNFVLGGKEYPLGYTSYLAIQKECRFMDENLFKALLGLYDELLHDFTKENLTIPTEPATMDALTKAELDRKLQHSYEQSLNGQGVSANRFFDELERDLM